jgi:hypothetical protein
MEGAILPPRVVTHQTTGLTAGLDDISTQGRTDQLG